MFFFLQRHLNNIHVTFCRKGAAGVAVNILKYQIKSVSVNQFTPISSHCSTNNHMKRFSFSSSSSLYTRYHLGINLCCWTFDKTLSVSFEVFFSCAKTVLTNRLCVSVFHLTNSSQITHQDQHSHSALTVTFFFVSWIKNKDSQLAKTSLVQMKH